MNILLAPAIGVVGLIVAFIVFRLVMRYWMEPIRSKRLVTKFIKAR